MTSSDISSTSPSVYDRCDPIYLRDLREAAGIDIHILARNACLSVGQLRELESGASQRLFYSDTIKRQAYKRVLALLGAPQPETETPQAPVVESVVTDAHLATLDSIVAMSHRPALSRPVAASAQALVDKLKAHPRLIGMLVLCTLGWVGVMQYNNHLPPVVSNAESPASVMSPVPAPIPPPATAQEQTCAHSQETMTQLKPLQAHKEGRYVHLVSSAATTVCVVDAQKQATSFQLKSGESRSVYGSAPWQISGSELQKIRIYFQGGLVVLPDAATQRLQLLEAPISH